MSQFSDSKLLAEHNFFKKPAVWRSFYGEERWCDRVPVLPANSASNYRRDTFIDEAYLRQK